MERILVYPFDESFIPILEHADLLDGVEIHQLVSKNGWGLVNKKFQCSKKEIIVTDDFSKGLEECTGIWFRESTFEINEKSDLLTKVEMAIRLKKVIIYTRAVDNEIFSKIKQSGLLYPLRSRDDKVEGKYEYIFPIEKPVIFVAGIMEQMDKFDTQLIVFDELKSKGYKVVWLSSRLEGELLGAYAIPEFMKKNVLSPRDKIIKFNNYVKELEARENPDLFLIGIPGEATPFSPRLVFNFGITMYEICQSMKPDCVILNTVLGEYSEECVDSIKKTIESRQNIEIDYINVIPVLLNDEVIERDKAVSHVSVSDEIAGPKVKGMKKDFLYYLRNKNEGERLVNDIINRLNRYAITKQL